ncbi:MAG: MIP/aquaporin family protein [Bacteroidota bacterium]
MTPYLAEFIGTALLIVLGTGVNASVSLKGSYSNAAGWLTVCFGWALGVTMAVYAVGSISGAHLNPAVSLALALRGDLAWAEFPIYALAQLGGAILGSAITWLHFLPHWEKTDDAGAKLGVFATGPAIPNTLANFLSELIATFVLVIGLLFIGTNEFTQGLNPMVVGTLILAIGLSLGGTTGFAINPARDLGPRIAHAILPIAGKGGSNWGYAWIPVLAPFAGAVLAAVVFGWLNG